MTPALSNSLYELANTHFYLGHWEIADSLTRQVLAMSRTLHGDQHPSVAEDLINLGAIQFEAGHYAEAERYYREALAINSGWYGQDSYVTASTLTMLGRALVREEKYDEAISTLQQALAHPGARVRTGASPGGLGGERAGHGGAAAEQAGRRRGRVPPHGGHLCQGVPGRALPHRHGALEPGERVHGAEGAGAGGAALPAGDRDLLHRRSRPST